EGVGGDGRLTLTLALLEDDMRVVTVRRLLVGPLSALVLFASAGCLRAEEKAEKEHEAKVKVEYMSEGGKAEEREFNLEDSKDLQLLTERMKQGKVISVEVEKPPEFLKFHWDLGLWSLVVFLGLLFI